MDSRSVAIAPPSESGGLDHPCVARFGPLPGMGASGPTPSRPYFPVRAPPPPGRGVHDGPTRVFTMLRFRCSRWTDLSVHDGPKRAPGGACRSQGPSKRSTGLCTAPGRRFSTCRWIWVVDVAVLRELLDGHGGHRSGWRWTGQGPEALQRRLRPPGPADSTAGARRAAKGDTQTTDRPSLIRRPVCDRPAHSQRGERSHGRWWAVSPPRWSSPLLGGNRSAVRRIFFGPAPLVVLPTIGPTRLGGTMPKKTTKPAFGGSAISFEGCTDTLESLYGSAPIGPSEMTKKIWTYVKRRGLAKKH